MTRVWRLCRERYAATAYSGEGARRYSGRWHHRGTPVVYTSTTRSLAAIELLVHVDPDLVAVPFVFVPADVPEDALAVLSEAALPERWRELPAPSGTRDLGSAWAREQLGLALALPSVVIPGERNVLLNPLHPRWAEVEVGEPEPFAFDPRLLGG